MATTQSAIPPFERLGEKQLRALGEKLDRLQDPMGFKHHDLLGKHTDGPQGPLLWHLVRHGLVGLRVQSAGLYGRLGETVPRDVAAADVIGLLRHVPEDMGTLDRGEARLQWLLTPGVLAALDGLLVRAYVNDPAAMRAARDELPHSLQVAIDFVRRRAGEAIDPAHAAEIFAHLAEYHSAEGLPINNDVPRIVDGEVVACPLRDDGSVHALVELFGTHDQWTALQAAWLRSHVAEVRSAVYVVTRNRDGLVALGLRDVIYLFGDGYWPFATLLEALEARADAPEALLAAASELLADGLAPFKIDAVQIKPAPEPGRGGGGHDDDAEDCGDDDDAGSDDGDYDGDDGDYDGDDGDEYGHGHGDDGSEEEAEVEAEPDAGPDNDRVRALAGALTVLASERLHARGEGLPAGADAAFDLDRVSDSDGAYLLRLRAALERLGPARAHAVIERLLAKQWYYGKASAVADVCHDAGVVEAVLTRLDAEGGYVDAELLAYCGPRVVPAIAAHAGVVASAEKRGKYREAINYILARAVAAKQAIEPGLDQYIDIGAIQFAYGGVRVDSVLALLDVLPRERYDAVMRAALKRDVDGVKLARCLRADASDGLLEAVFAEMLRDSAKISHGDLGHRLSALGRRVVVPLRRAFGDTPAQATLMQELERALSADAFAAFKATLGQAIETPEQELRRLCAAVSGPKVTIYRMTRAGRAPAADEVGRIGGAPRGVAEQDVPRFDGEAMEHVITLDVARMPGLGGAASRSVSLYLPDPGHAAHHEQGELVWRSEAELQAAPGSVEGAAAIDVEAFDVPVAIFAEECPEELRRIRQKVYAANGYALGGPLWMQDGVAGVDEDFLFQFDSALCHVNLGDCGIMYVIGGEVTWQCH